MITRGTVVVNVAPAMSLEAFQNVLEGAGSPATSEATACYQAIVAEGVDPAFALAIFKAESNYGTDPNSIVVKFGNKNPGNTRSSTIGPMPLITTDRGVFVRFNKWAIGFLDLARRLVAKDYVYAQESRTTIAKIIERWAPKGDQDNDPDGYVNTVISLMNQWIGSTEVNTMNDPTNKIDIVHPNKGREGASPTVIVIHVQEGTNYLPDFFRSSGDDSTMWCKQDGTLIRMEQDSDSAWTNGRMIEPIDHANPVIQGLYNQGVRNSNNYALTIENQGFASQGFTDAQVEANAKMCAYWMQKYGWNDVDSRIVGHFQIGEHKLCPGSKYPWAKLRARVKE